MGTWTRVVRETSVAHSGESVATAAMRVLTRCMSVVAICDRATKAAQTAVVASQVAAATSASGIETCESGMVMTHKYRGSIMVLSISKRVEPNKEQKEMTSGFQQGIFCKH